MNDEVTRLVPTKVRPLDGTEIFAGTDVSVRDFWSYAFSDLRTNIVRGVWPSFSLRER